MIFLVFIIYYVLVFFFPFEGLKLMPSISSIYLFEIIFITVVSILFKIHLNFRLQKIRGIVIKLLLTLALAAISLGVIKYFNFETPFKHLDNYILQLIVLAPIIEELIYRHVLFGLLAKKKIDNQNHLFFNSMLFSFSHAIAFFSLPSVFYPFIFLQLFYTFVLGWIITKSRIDHVGIQVPILLHFVFNLLFLLFLT
jgi:membrane protease YdiL (CAAX protease family)